MRIDVSSKGFAVALPSEPHWSPELGDIPRPFYNGWVNIGQGFDYFRCRT